MTFSREDDQSPNRVFFCRQQMQVKSSHRVPDFANATSPSSDEGEFEELLGSCVLSTLKEAGREKGRIAPGAYIVI
jgi:hypothetical protein